MSELYDNVTSLEAYRNERDVDEMLAWVNEEPPVSTTAEYTLDVTLTDDNSRIQDVIMEARTHRPTHLKSV